MQKLICLMAQGWIRGFGDSLSRLPGNKKIEYGSDCMHVSVEEKANLLCKTFMHILAPHLIRDLFTPFATPLPPLR